MIGSGIISNGTRGAMLCAALLVAGCADVERGFSDADMDRFVAAMIKVDCKVSFENAKVVEKATGFSDEKLRAITDYLKEKQLVAERDDTVGLKLINEGCP